MDREKFIKKFEKEAKVNRGVRFGVWCLITIGTLSFINFLFSRIDSVYSFQIGLGVAHLVDLFLRVISKNTSVNFFWLAFLINISISYTFFLLAIYARQAQVWAFGFAMILYAIDAFLYALFGQWLGVIFHVLAELGIFYGYKSLRALEFSIVREMIDEDKSKKDKHGRSKKITGIKELLRW